MKSIDAPQEAETLLLLGSTDLFVAEYAAALANNIGAKRIVCSGGEAHQGDLLQTNWNRPEAEVFAEALVAAGFQQPILLEPTSKNTGENVRNSLSLLRHHKISERKLCFFHKTYMTLRTRLTCQQYLTKSDFWVSAPDLSFEEYCLRVPDKSTLVSVMVGDLQRIELYPQRGFMAHRRIPPPVKEAFRYLVRLGYDKHLLQN